MRSKKALKKINDERLRVLVEKVRTLIEGLRGFSIREAFWFRDHKDVAFRIELMVPSGLAWRESLPRRLGDTERAILEDASGIVLGVLRRDADEATKRAAKALADVGLLRSRGDRPRNALDAKAPTMAPPLTRRSTLIKSLYLSAVAGSSAHAEIDPLVTNGYKVNPGLLRSRGDRPGGSSPRA